MIHPDEIPLPETKKALIAYYLFIDSILLEIWSDYVIYVEGAQNPERRLIFEIIFNELEFYEYLLSRVMKRISIDEVKAKKLASDLNSIFEFIEKLNKLNTDKVEPLTSIAETTLKLRTDEVKSKNIREQILKNSPNENKDFFVVPKVVE